MKFLCSFRYYNEKISVKENKLELYQKDGYQALPQMTFNVKYYSKTIKKSPNSKLIKLSTITRKLPELTLFFVKKSVVLINPKCVGSSGSLVRF